MIDKSLRQHYAMQGKIRNYLGKQKMVKAPKKWKSGPDHPDTELAYITKAEKDLILKADLHNSLSKGPNKGPSGIISLNSAGSGYGGPGPGRSSGNGGGGGNGGGYQDRIQRQAAANQAAANQAAANQAAAQRAMQATIAQAEKAEANRVAQSAAEGKVDVGFQEALKKTEDIRQREQEFLDTGDYDVFADTRLQPGPKVDVKDIMGEVDDPGSVSYDPSYKTPAEIRALQGTTDYGQFFRQPPVTEKPPGIMATIGGGLKKVFGETPLDWALTLGTAGGSTLARNIRAAKSLKESALAKKLGIDKWNLKGSKRKVSGVDTQEKATKKLVKHEPVDRDGIQQAVTGEKGLLTEGAETLGITNEQREQYMLMQKKMKTALGQGSYTNEQGQVIQLNDQQIDQLQNYLDKLDSILGTVLQTAAHGGRIDGPLMGGSRYI